jgi:hypothetical protein
MLWFGQSLFASLVSNLPICRIYALTLNIRNALLQDLLEDLGVLELLCNLGHDGLGELLLLADLNLSLISDP